LCNQNGQGQKLAGLIMICTLFSTTQAKPRPASHLTNIVSEKKHITLIINNIYLAKVILQTLARFEIKANT
jgi:hypothetical protein